MRVERRTVELPAGAAVAVVADTHGRPDPGLAPWLDRARPALVLHAGDVGGRHVLDDLAARAPLVAVRGNIDAPAPDLPDAVVLDLAPAGQPGLRILLTHIAVVGPRLRADVRRLAEAERAGLVICGHSHVPLLVRDGPRAVFNPGSVGPRRFQLPIVFGVLGFVDGSLRARHVEAATGVEWRPPGARAAP